MVSCAWYHPALERTHHWPPPHLHCDQLLPAGFNTGRRRQVACSCHRRLHFFFISLLRVRGGCRKKTTRTFDDDTHRRTQTRPHPDHPIPKPRADRPPTDPTPPHPRQAHPALEHTQTDREIERQRDRETKRQKHREAKRQRDIQTDRQTDRQTNRGPDKQTDRQTDKQPDRQTGRQTDRHPNRHKHTS